MNATPTRSDDARNPRFRSDRAHGAYRIVIGAASEWERADWCAAVLGYQPILDAVGNHTSEDEARTLIRDAALHYLATM